MIRHFEAAKHIKKCDPEIGCLAAPSFSLDTVCRFGACSAKIVVRSHFEACVKTAGFDEETKVGIIDMK